MKLRHIALYIAIACTMLSARVVSAANILDAVGVNKCNAGGAAFGVDTTCVSGCDSTQVDISMLQALVPAEYQSQFSNLCSDATNKCCAQRGDALCTKAAERVGLSGKCESSCGSGEVDAMTMISGLPSGTNPCTGGSLCCVPQGAVVKVQPLSGSNSITFNSLQKGASPSPTVTAAPPSPGYGLINPLGSRSIPTLTADLIKWISGLAGTFFILYLLWGGLEWMTAGGDGKKTMAARNRMLYAILGIVIIFTSYFLVDALISITNIPF